MKFSLAIDFFITNLSKEFIHL